MTPGSLLATLCVAASSVAARVLSSPLKAGPVPCSEAKLRDNWSVYNSLDRLKFCPLPILFDTSLYTSLDNPDQTFSIRACSVGNLLEKNATMAEEAPEILVQKSGAKAQLIPWGDSGSNSVGIGPAVSAVRDFIKDNHLCEASTAVFSYYEGVVVGAYAGSKISADSAASSLQIKGPQLLQICSDGRNSEHVLGIAVDTEADFGRMQEAVKSWSEATCVESDREGGSSVSDVTLSVYPEGVSGKESLTRRLMPRWLERRADCRAIQVISGDGCDTLAKRCGISGNDFMKYNTKTDLCATLAVGQWVCCSAGTLPDMTPKPGADGVCATYLVVPDDNCHKIATSHQITVDKLISFNNKKTWGWTGCDGLQAGIRICLSTGDAPMPAPISNAVCGPTMPGTVQPPAGRNISTLNPCPLKVCCNVWGQCGTDKDFCVISPSSTGNPGTSAPGKNSCISNCGMDIVMNTGPATEWRSVGYFEAWNNNRLCLHQDVDQHPSDEYSIIHFSFAVIAPGTWDVVIPADSQRQFDIFVNRDIFGAKKVLAFGGWTFSTDASTYKIFRDVVLPGNRDVFARKVVDFINQHNLDGVDLDWEYPGAPDLPRFDPGGPNDGFNYLVTLLTIKSMLPAGKTLSIAAPASYWYLKAFPIEAISAVVDYIVYMTYDLHGQWDYDNRWASPGCPEGNCLRSHINMTETKLVLAMITKAGVPNNKIMVGVSSYGRSFKMVDGNCAGPNCHFVGPESAAKKGICTDTAGYIANAEILSIVANDRVTWSESHLMNVDTSMTDIIVYDGDEWVAWMTPINKWFRVGIYNDLNFGGIADWAIDLRAWNEGEINTSDPEDESNLELACDETFASIEDIDRAKDKHSMVCNHVYVLRLLSKMQKSAMDSYNDLVANNYDHKYDLYKDYVQKLAAAALVAFIKKRSNDFFDCYVEEQLLCCDWFQPRYGVARCRYCDGSCSGYRENTRFMHELCPPNLSQRGVLVLYPELATARYNVRWQIKPGKQDAFLAAALSEASIPTDWIGMVKDQQAPVPCAGVWDCECGASANPETCEHTGYWYNAPYITRTEDDGVSNPKDFVQEAMSKLGDIGSTLDNLADQIEAYFYMGEASISDLVEAAALPILMLDEAVNTMKEVAKIGEEIEEEKRKNFLILLLTSLLMLVPFVGQAVGTIARLGTLARTIALLGEAGQAALDIYSVVDDPSNAPLAIFGLVLGAGALRDITKVAPAAKAARNMNAEDLAKLGGRVESRMNAVKSVAGHSCAR